MRALQLFWKLWRGRIGAHGANRQDFAEKPPGSGV